MHFALELAAQHGTPFYVYDLTVLRHRVRQAREAMPAKLLFAVKANPNPEVLRALRGEVDGLDVASRGEIETALSCGFAGETLSFTGPAKTDDALAFAVAHDVLINVESTRELTQLLSLKHPARVRLRVNPRVKLKSWRVSMWGEPSPFGIDEEVVSDALPLARRLRFDGLHVNPGGQCTSVGGYVAAAKAALDLAEKYDAPALNFGGGWGVTADAELDVRAAGEKLRVMLERFTHATGRTLRTFVEPGRWLAAPCGLYVTRVVSQKISRGRHFVLLDGGLNHHLGATGLLGGARLRVVNLSRADGPLVTRTLAGPLCTPLDTFGDHQLVEPRDGDVLGIEGSGAYGPSFSPTRFLSHAPPREFVRGG